MSEMEFSKGECNVEGIFVAPNDTLRVLRLKEKENREKVRTRMLVVEEDEMTLEEYGQYAEQLQRAESSRQGISRYVRQTIRSLGKDPVPALSLVPEKVKEMPAYHQIFSKLSRRLQIVYKERLSQAFIDSIARELIRIHRNIDPWKDYLEETDTDMHSDREDALYSMTRSIRTHITPIFNARVRDTIRRSAQDPPPN